jgi:tetratricopeptide (TPR) repeat protein
MKKMLISSLVLSVGLLGYGLLNLDAEAKRHHAKHHYHGLACSENNIDAIMQSADTAFKAQKWTSAANMYRCAIHVANNWHRYTPEMSMGMQRLGMTYINAGNYTQAEPLLLKLSKLDEKEMGPYYRDVGIDCYLLGFLYADQKRFDKAEPMYLRALNIFEKQVSPNDRDIALMLKSLAGVYRETDRLAEAESLEERARLIENKKVVEGKQAI